MVKRHTFRWNGVDKLMVPLTVAVATSCISLRVAIDSVE